MFSIYDRVSEIYDTPVFMLNKVQAERWFFTLCQKAEGRFEYYKDDMELHYLGKFDLVKGSFESVVETMKTGKQIILRKEGDDENSNGS